MAPAVSTVNSAAGKATHGGIVGFEVMGGSPLPTAAFRVAPPAVRSARWADALPTWDRSGTPKPKEAALGSTRGNAGAGAAAACCVDEGKPVWLRGGRGCDGGPSCAGGGLANNAAVDACTGGPAPAGKLWL